MQDPDFNSLSTDVAVLTTNFNNHKANEETWQENADLKLDNITEMLTPLQAMVYEHRQTLFGPSPDKDNGLNSEIKNIKKWREVVDNRWYKLVALLFAIEVVFNILSFIFKTVLPMHETAQQQTTTQTSKP